MVRRADASKSLIAAVGDFAKYLSLATTARVRVVEDGHAWPDGLAAIHVGDTSVANAVALDLPDLTYGDRTMPNVRGSLVKMLDPRTLVIRGATETATGHAMVGFLRRYVGVRQYWPGEPGGIGDMIPERPSLSVPPVEWRDWPYFLSFQMSLRPFGAVRPRLDFYRRAATLPASENYDRWLPPSRYVAEHPEYYALVNGRRLRPRDSDGAKGWQPCVSNPEVRRVMGEAVLDYFRKNPDALGINFSVNDGGGDCTCAECRALDGPETDYSRGIGLSDRYVYLANEVCRIVRTEFPDKWVVHLAYASAARAPQTVRPDPMLLPVLTTPSVFPRWDAWTAAGADHLGLYAHHDDMYAILAKWDPHQQAKRIRYAVDSGRARSYYIEAHTQWPFADVVPHVTAELLWDPRRDVDELLTEYRETFFGEAAAAMADHHAALRRGYERWLAEEGVEHPAGRDISSYHQNKLLEQYRVLTPEEATEAANALDRAATVAKGVAAERVRLIAAVFRLQRLALEQGWAAMRLRDAEPASVADVRELAEDAETVYRRSEEAAVHIRDVLEGPEIDRWKFFRRYPNPNQRYVDLKSGVPGSELRAAVVNGITAAEEAVRRDVQTGEAVELWRELADATDVPDLRTLFEAAAARAESPAAENLLEDGGFEAFGSRIAGGAGEDSIELDPSGVREAGVHLTFPDRTPYRIAVTREEVHSGDYALRLEHCARARLTRYVRAEPGTRYRLGCWVRHDEGAARRYEMAVDVRLADGSYRNLSRLVLPDDPGRWRRYVTAVETPEDAATLFLRVYAENQAAGTTCWVDDLFIKQVE